ncbi:MAG: hypothetical protein WC284_18220 [Candidimonas sp.]
MTAMKALFNHLTAHIRCAAPAKPAGINMTAQPDRTQLAELAEHVSKLACQGFEVVDMDISGDAPTFTVRPMPRELPSLAGYTVQEF